jgi:integrase
MFIRVLKELVPHRLQKMRIVKKKSIIFALRTKILIRMSVTLRERENTSKNIKVLYLDIYHNGTRQREFLTNLKIIAKPKDAYERDLNKKNYATAKNIRDNRAIELESNNYNVAVKHKQDIDFLEFYKNTFIKTYSKADLRVHNAVYNKFETYITTELSKKKISSREIDFDKCTEFYEYLQKDLSVQSSVSYFKRFKTFLNYCKRKKIFTENPADNVILKKAVNLKDKSVLTFEEIEILFKTPASNENVKRAFLFALYSGLRFVDVRKLRKSDVNFKEKTMSIKQAKTGINLNVNLHDFAIELIKNVESDKLFDLPTNEGTNKCLRKWAKDAGIDKHISFHCARHTYGTLLIFNGADSMVVQKLMGFSSAKYMNVYVRIANDMKQQAVNLLQTPKL